VEKESAGRTIDMGQLGLSSPSLQSVGEATADDVDKHSIKKIKVNFRPSTLLRDQLSITKFETVPE
jgi:hypothetical protein